MSGEVTVNGVRRTLAGVDPSTTALHWLRAIGLTGAKEGCAEGECGACAVMVLRPDGADRSTYVGINSCLVPVVSLDGQEVVTAEGLGTVTDLHPVQHEMAIRGGSQCGYCTPGFVCAMAAEYYRGDRAATAVADRPPAVDVPEAMSEPDHERGANGFDLHALSGNLCRCTGYRPIRDAAYALGQPEPDDRLAARRDRSCPPAVPTRVTGGSGTYIRPRDLAEALAIMAEHPDAVLVAGSTDWGVEVNLRGARAGYVVGVDRLEELRELTISTDHVELGAALTLSELETRLAGRIPLLHQLFPQFASRLIRNGATLGGNLGTGSPIGDTAPALLALDAQVVLVSAAGERVVDLSAYFTGYRQSVRLAGEIIRSVRIPQPLLPVTAMHKIAKRRFDDISSVAVAVALHLDGGVVRAARIGLGGVAATPIRAYDTEAALVGGEWTSDRVRAAAEVLRSEGTPLGDHRASAAYRRAMLAAVLPKLYAEQPASHDGALAR